MFRARGLVLIVIAAATLSGCSTRTASYSDTATIAPPAFAPPPPEPGASPQLDAVVLRDTGGVEPDEPNADPALVAPALAALPAAVPGVDELSDFWFEDDSVYFTFSDPAFRGRAVSGHYDGELYLGSPAFSDSPTFPITAIDPAVATALTEGLASRFPTLRVIRPRLNPELSYELGLSWHVDLDDGRGNLGTVYTDLDGTVTVVDVRPDVRTITRIPAVVLIVVLAVLPLQAWLRAGRADVRISNPLEGLHSVTWVANVSPDGRLAVSISYEFGDDDTRDASIRLPSGAVFAAVDGEPVAATIGRYADVTLDGDRVVVTYERTGVVTRYDDGVIVDFKGVRDGHSDPDNAMFPCPRCYLDVEGYGDAPIFGAVFADDVTDARVSLSGVDQLHTGEDGAAVRFVGVLPGADSAALIAWLPASAAPDAPTVSGVPGAQPALSAADAFESMQQASRDAGSPSREKSSGPPLGQIATAVILSVLWIVLVIWIVLRIVSAKRALDVDQPDAPAARDAAFSPPSSLEPALVGVVVGDAGRGERSIVSATLLALANRGVIRIDGVDSERYTLTVPPGARGSTTFEEAVLAELRPQGQLTSTATFSGPPLWGKEGPAVARRLRKVVLREARRQRLLRVTLAATVLVPASLAMGIIALIGSGGTSVLAWLVTFVGPIVAVLASLLTGTNLTAKGRTERERWLAYGGWLRANTQLHDVGAPGIATWGDPLVYATVLGAAPKAADALGVG